MSRMTARLLLLGIVLTASSGCGTVLNLTGHEQIYGGTSLDAASVMHAWKDLFNPEDQHELSTRRDEGAVLACCCDLPLSAMGDTFTLPVTCYHWVKEKIKPASSEAPATHMDPVTGQPVLAAQPTARNADKSAN
jgi:uncharacterized protein YceK